MERDKAFYQKMEVPEPTRCPACREMRRLAFRNERSLYLDACSLCKKQMFSMHHPSKTYPVFCNSCWYSDKWDAHDYARDFDFNRPFFEQFKELLKKVPRMATSTFDNENSDFVNCATRDKNCYLIFGAKTEGKPTDDGDIYFVKSLDSGRTFSKPERLNTDKTSNWRRI